MIKQKKEREKRTREETTDMSSRVPSYMLPPEQRGAQDMADTVNEEKAPRKGSKESGRRRKESRGDRGDALRSSGVQGGYPAPPPAYPHPYHPHPHHAQPYPHAYGQAPPPSYHHYYPPPGAHPPHHVYSAPSHAPHYYAPPPYGQGRGGVEGGNGSSYAQYPYYGPPPGIQQGKPVPAGGGGRGEQRSGHAQQSIPATGCPPGLQCAEGSSGRGGGHGGGGEAAPTPAKDHNPTTHQAQKKRGDTSTPAGPSVTDTSATPPPPAPAPQNSHPLPDGTPSYLDGPTPASANDLPGIGKTYANLHSLGQTFRMPVFGVPLEMVMRYQEQGYIPIVVQKCIRFLWPHASKEGLFRVAGLKSELDRIVKAFDEGQMLKFDETYEVHVVAGVLKQFFRSLPEPIMTFEMYRPMLETQEISDEKERVQKLRRLCDRLPECNHALLESFFLFLKHIVDDEHNLMGARNIAIIFAPSFLRCKNETPAQFMSDQQAVQGVLVDILGNVPAIFGVLRLNSITDRYALEEDLGSGAFAVVKRCRDLDSGRAYAVKIIKKANLAGTDAVRLQQEIAILRKVRHPGVICLRGVCESADDVYLIMDLVDGGELFDEIVAHGAYGEYEASTIVRNILKALKYLHDLDVVHRDIKPENILLFKKGSLEIKLADFGLSKMFEQTVRMSSAVGSPGYVAPEVLFDDSYGKPVDMWSVGVIAYILLSGTPPFYHKNVRELFKKIMAADYKFPPEKFDSVSAEGVDFIKGLLVVDPEKRMSAEQALGHAWLRETTVASKTKLKVDAGDFVRTKTLAKIQKEEGKKEMEKATKNTETGVPHDFHKKTFYSPVWCMVCQGFIWGLRNQGYGCSKCDVAVHSKCVKRTKDTCTG